ncbi:MAG: hypothetical protein JO332_19645 [Planctomycetaceae bacterium]|nr:hypothetical protein [Planctomycetaceae bacterium]
MKAARAAALLAALALSGCGTFANLIDGSCCGRSRSPAVYGGVAWEALNVVEQPLWLLYLPIDLPLTLAFDTLTLPLTVYTTASSGQWIPPEPLHTDAPSTLKSYPAEKAKATTDGQ